MVEARKYTPTINQKAEKIQRTFSVVLTLFSKCHNIYNQNAVTEEDIASLGK